MGSIISSHSSSFGALALTLTSLASAPAIAQVEVRDISLRFESTLDVAASPRNPLLSIAIRGDGKVLRSADTGATYLETSLPELTEFVGLDWDAGGIAYAMSSNTVSVSSDGAQTWISYPFPGQAAVGFAASKVRPLELWVVASDGTAWSSMDGGQAWQASPPTSVVQPEGIALSATGHGEVVVFGGRNLSVSRDAGATWTASPPVVNDDFITGAQLVGSRIVRVRVDPFIAHLVTHDVHVDTSDDEGATWTLRTTRFGNDTESLLELDPRNVPGTLYWSDGHRRLRTSQDAGSTWQLPRPLGEGANMRGLGFPSGSTDLVLYADADGLRRAVGSGPFLYGSGDFRRIPAQGVARNPVRPDHLVARAGPGVVQTFDGGATWSELEGGILSSLRFGPTGRLYGLLNGRLQERVGGAWVQLGGLSSPPTVQDFDVSERNPDLVVVLSSNLIARSMWFSVDAGDTWTESFICNPQNGDPSCPTALLQVEIIERLTLPTRIAVAWETAQWTEIVTTDDFGATWIPRVSLPSGGSAGPAVSMAQSRQSPGEILVGFGSGNGMQVSSDGLETLAPIGSPAEVERLAVGAGLDDLMVRTADSGLGLVVEHSVDSGQTWDFVASTAAVAGGVAGIEMGVSGANYVIGGPFGIFEVVVSPVVSTPVCDPPVLNSAGYSARLVATGSSMIASSELSLDVELLPANVPCLFLASQTTGLIPNPGGSLGDLCLTGSIGRFRTIRFSGIAGATSLDVDPSAIAQPNGPVPAVFGSTWAFQAWYRDTVAGTATSNLTGAASVTFR